MNTGDDAFTRLLHNFLNTKSIEMVEEAKMKQEQKREGDINQNNEKATRRREKYTGASGNVHIANLGD